MSALENLLRGGGAGSFLTGALGLWVFSAAVCAMSTPNGNSSAAYQWLYQFLHLLAANLDRLDTASVAQVSATRSRNQE